MALKACPGGADLVLSRGGHVAVDGQVGEVLFDLGRAHFGRVALVMNKNIFRGCIFGVYKVANILYTIMQIPDQ